MRPSLSVQHTANCGPPERSRGKTADHVILYFRNTGKTKARGHLLIKKLRRGYHNTAGKVPNGVRWKNLLRRYRVRRLPEILRDPSRASLIESRLGISAAGSHFAHACKPPQLELAKGFEPPTL
jgi:hypothetical protein